MRFAANDLTTNPSHSKKSTKKKASAIPLPPSDDWRTTDHEEIFRRAQRALTPEQLQRNPDLKATAAKKQRVTRFLTQADLPEEAEPHQ